MPIPQLSQKIKSRRWQQKKVSHFPLLKKYRGFHRKKINYPPSKNKYGYKKPSFNIAKKLTGLFLFLILLLFFAGIIVVAGVSRSLPDPNHLMDRQIAQSTTIYDRAGQTILYEIHGDEKRTLVNLNEIPPYLKQATIAVEDKDFYKHGGFSLWAIFRTAVTNIIFNKKAGASTLTQQFIKNSILTNEKTYIRKIKELILAYRLEKKFTKDEILQLYFNEIPYGSTSYGVEAASQRYFGKKVSDINLAESAILAALPQAPSRYSPYGSNKDQLIARQHFILDLMVAQKYIDKAAAEEAKNFALKFKEPTENILAPHFVMYVKEMLSDKYGEKMVEQGGLKIYTTLDLYKQKIAEEVIKEKAEKNKEQYNANNAALVSIDPKNGQILAMVGSRDFFDENIDGQVNVANRPRQPGSSMKPLVYATAFIKGYTPDTILYDVVTNFSNNPAEPYEPHNYDSQEHGPVTMKKALAGSLNIPAVKTIYLAGIDNVLDLAQNLGYTTLSDRNRFGLSLVLGGGEVKLIEHTNAFSAFAREGEIHLLESILKIEDKDGKVIEEYKDKDGKKVFTANIARLINNILSDNEARSYIFGAKNWLTLNSRPVAAKTGTTNDYHDAWTIGYTPSIVTGVWVGNSDNKEMRRGADGSVVAAPIWHDYMQKVLGDTPIENFKSPEIIKTGKGVLDGNIEGKTIIKIDKASDLLATELTPPSFIEEKTFYEAHSILYYIDKDNPRGDALKDPALDPQFNLWESRVLGWAEKEGFASSTPPIEYDNVHKEENKPKFFILEPANNQIILEPLLATKIEATAPRGINRAEYYINDNLIFTNYSYPFNLEKEINFLNNGFHGLTVKVCDDVDNCSSEKVEFNLILDEEQKIKKGDININLIEPANGLAVNNIDFPLILKTNINNPILTAKVIFYYQQDNEDPQAIATAFPEQKNEVAASWPNIPPSNIYAVYAEAFGWDGSTIKSDKITISITNTNTEVPKN
ncbi:hypothetical protein COX67_03065 [Candidatus Falkowbacteria bacterium CG_4_10_14_0_2_um_filter_36_22]|uniref:Uncharacterized protein n=1 Tax=Candidatus Falkowbacteria bacterium CG02_land_8_20_14_3_00_36_14 TaxID=1974560 RepID=A0A2M7DQB9_9BACT|nr:MAG: hypothetical protein COS18_01340 [Candidatus Falkowbacteria bacterium CG02_land_8_20_14_3_00_36_14]PIX11363.1 MAG: hypothetical protein COZ73_02820 [Candidatus Falkowbacteria bacterium CG_4_8_14_3_um_filter_36_11]PJA10820.1 MAG: hypothetical protein COX67_03065 [Candidatus Falkowbacteria bacterium CG_4_10_14_0_2_um_filter_36_22]